MCVWAGNIVGRDGMHSFFLFNIYLFLRQTMSRGGAETEGDTESKQAPGSELSAQPDTGIELMEW